MDIGGITSAEFAALSAISALSLVVLRVLDARHRFYFMTGKGRSYRRYLLDNRYRNRVRRWAAGELMPPPETD